MFVDISLVCSEIKTTIFVCLFYQSYNKMITQMRKTDKIEESFLSF